MTDSITRLRNEIDSKFITWGVEGPHADDQAARDDIRVGVVFNAAKALLEADRLSLEFAKKLSEMIGIELKEGELPDADLVREAIVALRQQLAEATAARAELAEAGAKLAEDRNALRRQLTEAQSQNVKLRDAVHECADAEPHTFEALVARLANSLDDEENKEDEERERDVLDPAHTAKLGLTLLTPGEIDGVPHGWGVKIGTFQLFLDETGEAEALLSAVRVERARLEDDIWRLREYVYLATGKWPLTDLRSDSVDAALADAVGRGEPWPPPTDLRQADEASPPPPHLVADCRHVQVVKGAGVTDGSIVEEWWECEACGALFVPSSHQVER